MDFIIFLLKKLFRLYKTSLNKTLINYASDLFIQITKNITKGGSMVSEINGTFINSGMLIVNYFPEGGCKSPISDSESYGSWSIISPSSEKQPITFQPSCVQLKNDSVHCYGTIEKNLITSASKVYLHGCRVLGKIIFLSENQVSFKGTIFLDEKSSIRNLKKTQRNAEIIRE